MEFNFDIPLESLTKRELIILKYVHDHSLDILQMSVQAFAKEIHYSTATVIRFCKKLGYSGYAEFKFDLEKQLIENEQKEQEISSFSTVQKNITSDLQGTTSLLINDDLIQIVKILASNVPVYLYEPGGLTSIAVSYLESMLIISGCQFVYKSPSTKTSKQFIHSLKEGNVFIFISSSGNYQPTLTLAKEAKIHGMTVISISSLENNELADISDYNLRYFSKNVENKGADLTSRLCTFYVLSSLITYLNAYKKGTI